MTEGEPHGSFLQGMLTGAGILWIILWSLNVV